MGQFIFNLPPRIIDNEKIKVVTIKDVGDFQQSDYIIDGKVIANFFAEQKYDRDRRDYFWHRKLKMYNQVYMIDSSLKSGWCKPWVNYLYLDNICGGWLRIADEKRLKKCIIIR
jgi:hypothetical protein